MRGRSGSALLAFALAFASSPAAWAYDRVQTSHSSDPGLLDGLKMPVTAEVRVFGPWQVQVPGSGEPVAEFADHVAAQHYALAYGDHSARLAELCRLLDIRVV